MNALASLPEHLRKYIVTQDYSKYTPLDHAVWRYVLRQLRSFLGVHAHESYLEGLKKTGITIERIPRISEISEKLEAFGWRALPVSGFIPPAAFMELQSLSILPIASDMRSLEHLAYTPAPDIVHEAAGHAPILAHPEFAEYLRQYAQVARKAIINHKDLQQYEAIRKLSDLKESPTSTPEQIAEATHELEQVNQNMGDASEAGELSRMNWWTAEYGLIGTPENPKIFGAGLLSSVGESRWCLSQKVRHLPLTVDCIHQSYDITEPQPQLFVTPSFAHLSEVLEEMASQMAFRVGGRTGFFKAVRAETVNTVELNSGLQISGQWSQASWESERNPIFIKAIGPSQISYNDVELSGQGPAQHPHGFSTPLGSFKAYPGRCPSTLSEAELEKIGLKVGTRACLKMSSEFCVEGTLQAITRKDSKLLLLSWKDCRVTQGEQVYFEPEWGLFDQAVGLEIRSVFGGPSDPGHFGERHDFVAARVPVRQYSPSEKQLFSHYQALRDLRDSKVRDKALEEGLRRLLPTHRQHFPSDWLLLLEALELVLNRISAGPEQEALESELRQALKDLMQKESTMTESIRDGLALASQLD